MVLSHTWKTFSDFQMFSSNLLVFDLTLVSLILEKFPIILDLCQPPPYFHAIVMSVKHWFHLEIPEPLPSILPKPPPQLYLEINSTKLPFSLLIHLDHSHGKTFHSPMQYFQIYSYSVLCLFQSRNYLDTFHSSKNSTILGIGLISPPEHFTPLYQPHLSNI